MMRNTDTQHQMKIRFCITKRRFEETTHMKEEKGHASVEKNMVSQPITDRGLLGNTEKA